MEPFVKKFLYNDWKNGRDFGLHPEHEPIFIESPSDQPGTSRSAEAPLSPIIPQKRTRTVGDAELKQDEMFALIGLIQNNKILYDKNHVNNKKTTQIKPWV